MKKIIKGVSSIIFVTIFFLASMFTTCISANAKPVKRIWAPYNELYDLYGRYYAIPKSRRDFFNFDLKIEPEPLCNIAGIKFSVANGDVHIAPDGTLVFPISDSLHRSNPDIYVNVDTNHKLALWVAISLKIEKVANISYGDLIGEMNLASSEIRSNSGIWGLFMPKPDGLIITFSNESKANRIVLTRDKSDDETFSPDQEGRVFIPANLDFRKYQKAQLKFFATPASVLLHFKDGPIVLYVDSDT